MSHLDVANPIDVDDAKKHCRIDHGDDDEFIEGLIEAAFYHLYGENGALNREAPAAGESIPVPLRQAMLLLIGTLYEHRETVITGTIVSALPAYHTLIQPYRKLYVE